MNKFALLMIAGFMSLSAHATTGLSMNLSPNEPIVFTSNIILGSGESVEGPWFHAALNFQTDIEATVIGLDIKITSVEGHVMTKRMQLPRPLHIMPGVTSVSEFYMGSLPASTSYTYQFEVKVLGNYVQKGDSIALSGTFKTQ